MRPSYWLLLLLITSGCATIGLYEFDQLYGVATPENRIENAQKSRAISQAQTEHFNTVIQPIIENRCVVCHGCYDAPCQLKLESMAGLERGASKAKVYGERLIAAKPSQMLGDLRSRDIKNIKKLRDEGFFPVLNERQQTARANSQGSVFYQMLQLKQQHPLPADKLLDDSFDLSLNRTQQCPTIEEFEQYKNSYPLAGMPYGLPALSSQEHNALSTWLSNGAFMPKLTISQNERAMIDKWEKFFNGNGKKQQLVARYLFEHLYLANLYFQQGSQRFFKLVRSKTAPDEQVEIINTRRPYDNPFDVSASSAIQKRVYYRLVKNNDTIIAKRHMPYRFDLAKLNRLKQLFIDTDYQVTELPSYQLKLASNPFKTFQAIPTKSRYQFLLDEAQFSIMNFIKGPVCRGQVALNVIEDHFWVTFADPENIDYYHVDDFVHDNSDLLQLPAATSDKKLSLLYWRQYASRQKEYVAKQLAYLDKINFRQSDLDIDLIWSGQDNPNATLTVFRHFDSASVLKGFVGQAPKTAWFITYPLLERIHYLLVAGFDVYGNVGHQLKTRLYMDFLRMEAESNFIALLPKKDRKKVHEYWYRDTSNTIKDYIFSDDFHQLPETNIAYQSNKPQQELYQLLAKRTNNATVNNYQLDTTSTSNRNDYKLARLNNMTGEAVAILPQVSYLMVTGEQGEFVYTLLNNSAHSNVAHLFSENDRRIPAEDTLTVLTGVVGTYPNAFFKVSEQQLGEFVNILEQIKTPQDYVTLKDKFAIRRTSKKFWHYADQLHAWYKKHQAPSAGLLDFNRLENK